jgi:mannose-6-phosphate isomerase-like protein (cupin superfamily)
MMPAHSRIVPVLLSGGTGSRLWPLSRESCPKQLLSLLGEQTMLQQTALRVADSSRFSPPIRDQDVGKLVERLKTGGHRSATQTLSVHRPWGAGDRFQVKRITVNPGAKLSLQKHFHRAEHWVVVNGTAIVTRDDEEILLRENESVFVPLGCMHRLENPGKVPLNLIEVQSGAYLGEDDIVRMQDIYHRV